MKFYGYKACGSCQKAQKWLGAQSIPFQEMAIRETPPTLEELEEALAQGYPLKKLFNTSGKDYREQKLSSQLETMNEQAALKLLLANGNLVKRPFAISKQGKVLIGFNEKVWEEALVL